MTTTPDRDANTGLSRAFVDELARAGVTDACVAPGSRSTPLALALAHDERIRVHVHLDERSAAFFALGTARMSGRPAAVLTTSGTAASNLHPAVLEAHHGRVPLLVLTADRPPELRDTGAGQTVDQQGLFGRALRWEADPGPPEDRADAGAHWRSVAARAVAHTLGPPAGPVHINLPFREPLVPTGAELVPAPGRSDGRPWTDVVVPERQPDDAMVERVAAAVRANAKGVLLAGWGARVTPATGVRFAAAAGWPVFADPISGLRTGDHAVSTYDALLRIDGVGASRRPDLALRIGAPHTSKAATHWLAFEVRQWMIDPDGAWLDPRRAAEASFACDAELLLSGVADVLGPAPLSSAWLDEWMDVEARARRALDDLLDGWADPFEGRVARDLVAGLPDGANLAVASSMPVRDVESFAAPRDGLRLLANRGVNGIDGFTSTVLGAAAMTDGLTVALLGDLCFLHDSNGLLGAANRGIDATLVVVDNDGGGIFSFLPQADDRENFETLFGTPHGIDLAAVAAVHGVPCVTVEKANALLPAVEDAIGNGGVRMVLVRTDRAENVARHREAWAAVARAVA
ncbi:MAG: 2-succinyl-5-enolpyruvyl-6-hydroxy-3-cyclohexene-1-carboxylic-acid synthase [Acidimicrobiia bacterium]|nr:2-succinyl-5-enolpyruvyl-6-hydroxy-3-cyclohexene-1-carboxylic-acid synthase [Acidimicrobiia bacterium]